MSREDASHKAHSEWFAKRFESTESQHHAISDWLKAKNENHINYWIHRRLFEMTAALTADRSKTWLTVGDGYGFDAQYFYEKGIDVTGTDIAGTFLPLARTQDLIGKFAVENVEKLSFVDASFDYVFCKEAYHHFPRPHLGVYEMIRVAREGVVIIEPQDPVSRMPLLVALRNILDRIDTSLLQKLWKNRYSFEEVGNYVYKISEREIEKLANGIGLPCVAFKGINNNFYHPSVLGERADGTSAVFRRIVRKLRLLNLLSWLSLMPHQVLCCIIFKKEPSDAVKHSLEKDGFRILKFPQNPYLSKV